MHAATTKLPALCLRSSLLGVAIALAMLPGAGHAQQHDHAGTHMPAPAKQATTEEHVHGQTTAESPADAHAGHAPAKTPASVVAPQMDHAAMGHDMQGEQVQPVDHSGMDHATHKQAGTETSTPPIDHAAMGHDMSTMPAAPAQSTDHSGMDHSRMNHDAPSVAPTEPREPIPTPTDADRAAVFPTLDGHRMHDNSIQRYVLLEQLEAWDADTGTGLGWAGQAWIGTDLNRVWLRSEGERVDGHTEGASLEVLYGRSIAPWWDVVAGIRHDFKPGASQDFAAIGLIGLAPYKFEVEATAYIGESGQTAATVEVEYETLLSNRLILQSMLEANLHGQDDARRGIGSGLGTVEAGLRLRYEFTRRFAPYIGIVHERAFGRTADLRRDDGEGVDDTRVVAGLRIWF